MTPKNKNIKKENSIIKFVVPHSLKAELKKLALTRNITISSLLRLIASEYTNHLKIE